MSVVASTWQIQVCFWNFYLPPKVFDLWLVESTDAEPTESTNCLNSSLWEKTGIGKTSLLYASLVAQLVKNLPAMQETWVWSLGWDDPLEIPWRSTLVFWAGEFHGLYSSLGHKESDTTERLSLSLLHSPGYPWDRELGVLAGKPYLPHQLSPQLKGFFTRNTEQNPLMNVTSTKLR